MVGTYNLLVKKMVYFYVTCLFILTLEDVGDQPHKIYFWNWGFVAAPADPKLRKNLKTAFREAQVGQ